MVLKAMKFVYFWVFEVKVKQAVSIHIQGRIQDLIRGGAPDRNRPKTAILGPQFCRILVLGPHFWWSGGARAPGPPPPGSAPDITLIQCNDLESNEKFFEKKLSEKTFCQKKLYQKTN